MLCVNVEGLSQQPQPQQWASGGGSSTNWKCWLRMREYVGNFWGGELECQCQYRFQCHQVIEQISLLAFPYLLSGGCSLE